MTVRRLEQELGHGELQAWRAYSRIDPFMHERDLRDDYRAARTPLILGTVNRAKGSRSPRLGDFLFDWHGEGKPREDGNLIAARLRAFLGCIKTAQDRKKAGRGE